MAESPFASALGPDDWAALRAEGRMRSYSRGDTIFRVGDPGGCLMMIEKGVVRVSLPTAGGKDVILGDLGAGELIGEVAVLDGRGRSADAMAHTNVDLLEIGQHPVRRMLEHSPQACLRLLELLCGRLRASDERMWDIAFIDLRARLAKAILKLSRPGGSHSLPRLSLTQGELARLVVGSREAVNRQLVDWEHRGYIEQDGGWIILLKPNEIQRICQPGSA